MKINILWKQQGLTLVEIILGIAILGIIFVAMIPVFTYGFIQIDHSGDKSKALYISRQNTEKTLDGEAGGVITSTAPLIIKFGGTNIPVPGVQYKVETTYNGTSNKVTIKSFKPN